MSDILTPQEAAAELRCNYSTILQMIKEGKLRASKFGTQRYRIQRSALAECLAATEIIPQAIGTEVGTEAHGKAADCPRIPRKVAPIRGANGTADRYEKGWNERFKA